MPGRAIEWLSLASTIVGPGRIVRDWREMSRFPDAYPLFTSAAWLPEELEPMLSETEHRLNAFAANVDRERAKAAAIAECVERFAFLTWRPGKRRLVAHVDGHAPQEFSQLPFLFSSPMACAATVEKVWRNEKTLMCLPHRVSRGRSLPVPVGLVSAAAPAPWLQTTSGMASGTSLEEAMKYALLELIERDTVVLAWRENLHGCELDPAKYLSCRLHEHSTRLDLRQSQLILRAFLSDLRVPVVLAAIVHGTIDRPMAIAFGTAADCSWESAANRATTEAMMAWIGLLEGRIREHRSTGIRAPKAFSDHARLYQNPTNARRACRWLRPAGSMEQEAASATRTSNSVDALLRRVHDAGFRAFFFDMTPSEAGRIGLHVARAIVPGLVPIPVGGWNPGHLARYTQGPQFHLGKRLPGDRSVNRHFHPFP